MNIFYMLDIILAIIGLISSGLIIARYKIGKQIENHLQQNFNKYYNENILGKSKTSFYYKTMGWRKEDEDFPHDEFLDKKYKTGKIITYVLMVLFTMAIILYFSFLF